MKFVIEVTICLMVTLSLASVALAGDLYVFPAKGQSQEQLEQDKFTCCN